MKKKRQSLHAQLVQEEHGVYQCRGNWTILHLHELIHQFKKLEFPSHTTIKISGKGIEKFDSAGALKLNRTIQLLQKKHNQVELSNFSAKQQELLTLVQEKKDAIQYTPPRPKKNSLLFEIGRETVNKLTQMDGLIILVGSLVDKLFVACTDWRHFQFPSIVSIVNTAGLRALPILALLSFLIGVVLAYQMGLQLETYGASIFIAYLSGMAIFREFGPLITAIIVAGRTSSSFTAQIGSMKINEEIDALNTMGLSPIELLVVPKVLGLLFIFPFLIFWSDLFSTWGAMMMSKFKMQISYVDFLHRLQESVGLKHMMLGLYKAPTFAILIALVGCFQGFQVQANADSVGKQTTKSVVQALFLIIVADACYSVIYSWLRL